MSEQLQVLIAKIEKNKEHLTVLQEKKKNLLRQIEELEQKITKQELTLQLYQNSKKKKEKKQEEEVS
jgi:hypothetical protein